MRCPVLTGRDSSPHKQDSPRSWVVLCCAFLHSWIIVGIIRSYSIFLPVLMKEFNAGRDQIALINSLAIGISFSLAVITSWLANTYGCRVISSTGFVSFAVAYTLSSIVRHKYAMFFTMAFFQGIGMSLVTVSSVLCTVKYFKKYRSLALGIYASGGALGMMTLPIISQSLLDTMGWRNTFRVVAGGFALVSLLCIVYSPNVESEQYGATEENIDQDQRNQNCRSLRNMIDLSVWKVPKFVLAVVSVSVAILGFYSPAIHLVKFSEEIGISAVKASTLFTFIGIASLIARIGAGKLCDLQCVDASMVNMCSELLAAVTTFCLTFSTNYIHLAVLTFIYGLADGAFRTSIIILFTTSVIPSKSATAYGQGYLSNAPSVIAGPALVGLLADTTGTYTIAFYMCSVVMAAGAAVHLIPLFLRLKKTSRHFTLEQVYIGASDEQHQTEDKSTNDIQLSNLGYNGTE